MSAAKGLFVCAVTVVSCAALGGSAWAQCGLASWYHGAKHSHGGADGLTAAHRSLPFGTQVRVKHQGNGREVMVRINDRGPFINSRVIDLSENAKKELGMGGLAPVCLTVVTDKEMAPANGWTPQLVPLPERGHAEKLAGKSDG